MKTVANGCLICRSSACRLNQCSPCPFWSILQSRHNSTSFQQNAHCIVCGMILLLEHCIWETCSSIQSIIFSYRSSDIAIWVLSSSVTVLIVICIIFQLYDDLIVGGCFSFWNTSSGRLSASYISSNPYPMFFFIV